MKRVVESRLSLTLALLVTFSIVFVACEPGSGDAGGAATAADGGTPRFEVDPSWPKEMPNKWIMGSAHPGSNSREPRKRPIRRRWLLRRPRRSVLSAQYSSCGVSLGGWFFRRRAEFTVTCVPLRNR